MKMIYDEVKKNKKDTYLFEYNDKKTEEIINNIRNNYIKVERDIINSGKDLEDFISSYKDRIISINEIIEEYDVHKHRITNLVIYKPLDHVPTICYSYEKLKNNIDYDFLSYIEGNRTLNESYINIEKYKYLLSKVKMRYFKLISLLEISKDQILFSDQNIHVLKNLQDQEEIVKSLISYANKTINSLITEARINIEHDIESIRNTAKKTLIKSECYDFNIEESEKTITLIKKENKE